MKLKVLLLVGTRPNFVKVTQFKRVAAERKDVDVKIVHTGQHFDTNMADVFFEQFKLTPDYFLNTPRELPASQIGYIITKLTELMVETYSPDVLVVPGDVNSTLAGAIVGNKLGVPVAHLESGLRSNDRNMPEEVNRVLVDQVSDIYFVTEQSGLDHIEAENLPGRTFFVGNTMIDTMVHFEDDIERSTVLDKHELQKNEFALLTIHRPSNVDSREGIVRLIELLQKLSLRLKLVFPIHPRTIKKAESFGLATELHSIENLVLLPAQGYFEFQKLVKYAKFILTDSGGIQEESTFRKVPCLTLRENTERPSTITQGTNTLVPFEVDTLLKYIDQIVAGSYKQGQIPELWDGKATDRILKHLVDYFS